jgi:hypothetical protein
VNLEDLPLSAELANRRNAFIKRWLDRMLQSYPESATRFLSQEKDPFRNPIGRTLKEGLSALFDGLIQATDVASLTTELEGIVRMRAVQDFTASQAVSFPFLLKQIIRAECAADASRYSDELAALEERIDAMALLAFDLYMRCREQVFEIKANETKRSVFVLEKARQRQKSS